MLCRDCDIIIDRVKWFPHVPVATTATLDGTTLQGLVDFVLGNDLSHRGVRPLDEEDGGALLEVWEKWHVNLESFLLGLLVAREQNFGAEPWRLANVQAAYKRTMLFLHPDKHVLASAAVRSCAEFLVRRLHILKEKIEHVLRPCFWFPPPYLAGRIVNAVPSFVPPAAAAAAAAPPLLRPATELPPPGSGLALPAGDGVDVNLAAVEGDRRRRPPRRPQDPPPRRRKRVAGIEAVKKTARTRAQRQEEEKQPARPASKRKRLSSSSSSSSSLSSPFVPVAGAAAAAAAAASAVALVHMTTLPRRRLRKRSSAHAKGANGDGAGGRSMLPMPEARRRASSGRRRVEQWSADGREKLAVFANTVAAARFVGPAKGRKAWPTNIGQACDGKRSLVYEYQWRYVDEDE